MRRSMVTFATVTAMLAMGLTAQAQRGNGGGPKPKPTVTTMAPATMAKGSVQAPKGVHAKSGTAAVKTTQSAAVPKVKPAAAASAANTTVKSTAPKTKTTTTQRSTTTTTTASATTGAGTTPAPGTSAALSPVQQKLQRNGNLSAKLSSRLPAGTDLMTAASGFRNLGQFVAAVNVSNNLGIPFADLKTSMVTDGKSLGQSIKVLRPAANSTVEAQRAEDDAAITIRAAEMTSTTSGVTTSSTTTTTTTTTTTKTKTPKTSGNPRGSGGF